MDNPGTEAADNRPASKARHGSRPVLHRLGTPNKQQSAVGARHRPLDQQQVLAFIHTHQPEISSRHPFISKVTRHFLSLLDTPTMTTGTLAATDGPRRTVLTLRTVRGWLAAWAWNR